MKMAIALMAKGEKMRIDKAVEKLKKELGYKGCRNCKHQCEWLEHGGDGKLHFICPMWERKEDETN